MKKPNVIIINIDQLRSFTVGCYGNKTVKTPHIDSLAEGGMRFEQGISNNPVCVASRSILMTGQYSRTCAGAVGNAAWKEKDKTRRRLKDKTIAESFKDLGYKTGVIGKWHIDPDPHIIGFDYSCLPGSIGSGAALIENGGEKQEKVGFQEDHMILKAQDFLAENGDDPFFLYYNILPPHMPIFDIPYQYSRMYDPLTIPMRDNVWDKDGKLAYDKEFFHVYLWQQSYKNQNNRPITSELPDYFDLRHITALYYGAVSWCDAIVGEIIKSIKENDLLDDTLIVLTSDHGDNLGSQQLFNKDRPIEESIRVPMIFHHPNHIEAGKINNIQQAQMIDLFPTIIDYCGGEIPGSVQGNNLSDILNGNKETIGDNEAFIETAYHEIAIRTPHYKVAFETPYTKIEEPVITDLNDDNIENIYFYDLANDPFEMNNLAETMKNDPNFLDLKNRLITWNKDTPWLRDEDGNVPEWRL
ncbi:MAG: sulfatase-like hydrolase/transferase [Spirochaetaceae bacterium]